MKTPTKAYIKRAGRNRVNARREITAKWRGIKQFIYGGQDLRLRAAINSKLGGALGA